MKVSSSHEHVDASTNNSIANECALWHPFHYSPLARVGSHVVSHAVVLVCLCVVVVFVFADYISLLASN